MIYEPTKRDSLIINHVYYEQLSDTYFWTVDGIGCYWYDTYWEAIEDMGWTEGTYPHKLIKIIELADY